MIETPPDRIAHFQQLYTRDPDPWKVRGRWYEQRKRALLLASLPQEHYRRAFEPGCGNGELTAALARRCDAVLAADGAAAAVALARARLREEAPAARVEIEQRMIPRDWPRDMSFDLIVVSELAYYLDPADLTALVEKAVAALAPGGTLVLCHWRASFPDQLQTTTQVHTSFDAAAALHRLVRHEEEDFLLDVWSNDARPVSRREACE